MMAAAYTAEESGIRPSKYHFENKPDLPPPNDATMLFEILSDNFGGC